VGIKCTGLNGNIGTTVQLTGCSGNTGGSSGPIPSTSLATGGTITWANSDTTTVTLSVASGGVGCPAKNTLYTATGTSTADTTGSAPVGGKVKVFACVNNKSGAITLEPGKKAKIG